MPRTKEEILTCLENQVSLACRGVAQPIKALQTATGIKDAYTQHWIEELLSRARAMREQDRTRPIESIHAELMQWVVDHKDDIYSGFLTLKGRLSI